MWPGHDAQAVALLVNRQRPTHERFGLCILALDVIKRRQVVKAVGHVGVLRAQGPFPDRQRPLVLAALAWSVRLSVMQKVTLKELKDIPCRDFLVDPIDEAKVDGLAVSIKELGFWGGVTLRKNESGQFEIAAGHQSGQGRNFPGKRNLSALCWRIH